MKTAARTRPVKQVADQPKKPGFSGVYYPTDIFINCAIAGSFEFMKGVSYDDMVEAMAEEILWSFRGNSELSSAAEFLRSLRNFLMKTARRLKQNQADGVSLVKSSDLAYNWTPYGPVLRLYDVLAQYWGTSGSDPKLLRAWVLVFNRIGRYLFNHWPFAIRFYRSN